MSGMQIVDDEKKSDPFDLTPKHQSSRQRHSNFPSFLPTPNGNHHRSSNFPHNHHRSSSTLSAYAWRLRRLALRPVTWVVALLLTLTLWWTNGGGREWQTPEFRNRLKDYLPKEITRDLEFFPASHHRIHYVGRWTTAPNRLRIDGSFPGVYFDLNVTNTSSVVLSLQNSKTAATDLKDLEAAEQIPAPAQPLRNGRQFSFSAASMMRVGAPPISLLALVDAEEYVILPNATGLCSIRMKELDPKLYHTIRVIAPMTDNSGLGVVQVDGLWLDKGGQLLPVEGSIADTVHDEMAAFDAEDQIGEEHRAGLIRILRGESAEGVARKPTPATRPDKLAEDVGAEFKRRKKMVEIVTDDPANFRGRKQRSNRSGGADGLLAGVMGWEYLLGEMFSVDHVCVGAEGQCLLQNCIGGTGAPAGLGDVFFRSGPVDSPHFGHLWSFQSYTPDILIFNLGASDYYSITNRANEYNYTGGELFRAFEETYVTLIKSIRTMAYPNHPATIEMQRLGVDAYGENNSPATIPIFIMRPFGGELEWASQGAVNRLRAEGDKNVFWLDTSGWLDFEGTETRSADVFKDYSTEPPRYHLTERGNQKVAIYQHMHVCRYLASADEKCAFLPPEVYQGQVFDASVATFETYIENEKERQIHEIFWTEAEKEAEAAEKKKATGKGL